MTEAPAVAEASLDHAGFAVPMARSIVQPEMINRSAYEKLRAAEMPEGQAAAVAAHLPDWSQFATKQDLAELRAEMKDLQGALIRWMVGLFLTFTAVLGALMTSSNLLG